MLSGRLAQETSRADKAEGGIASSDRGARPTPHGRRERAHFLEVSPLPARAGPTSAAPLNTPLAPSSRAARRSTATSRPHAARESAEM